MIQFGLPAARKSTIFCNNIRPARICMLRTCLILKGCQILPRLVCYRRTWLLATLRSCQFGGCCRLGEIASLLATCCSSFCRPPTLFLFVLVVSARPRRQQRHQARRRLIVALSLSSFVVWSWSATEMDDICMLIAGYHTIGLRAATSEVNGIHNATKVSSLKKMSSSVRACSGWSVALFMDGRAGVQVPSRARVREGLLRGLEARGVVLRSIRPRHRVRLPAATSGLRNGQTGVPQI